MGSIDPSQIDPSEVFRFFLSGRIDRSEYGIDRYGLAVGGGSIDLTFLFNFDLHLHQTVFLILMLSFSFSRDILQGIVYETI